MSSIFKMSFSRYRLFNSWIGVIDGTIGVAVDLSLCEAQTLNLGACRLPERRRTQNAIRFLKQEAGGSMKTSNKTPKSFFIFYT